MTGEPYTVMVRRRGDTAWLEPVISSGDWEHTCTVCGTVGVWGPSWSWYGSEKEAERHPGVLPMFCTDVCRDQWAADNGVPVDRPKASGPQRRRRG